jgi:hypothetical protein
MRKAKAGSKQAGEDAVETDEAPRKNRYRPSKLAGTVAGTASMLASKQSQQTLIIARRWSDIVGQQLSAHTQPMAITIAKSATGGGTLTLKADGSAALLVQHHQREIIAKVNGVLGDGAIATIKLIQGAVQRGRVAPKPARPRLSQAEEDAVRVSVAGVQDDELRDRLARLMRLSVGEKTR